LVIGADSVALFDLLRLELKLVGAVPNRVSRRISTHAGRVIRLRHLPGQPCDRTFPFRTESPFGEIHSPVTPTSPVVRGEFLEILDDVELDLDAQFGLDPDLDLRHGRPPPRV